MMKAEDMEHFKPAVGLLTKDLERQAVQLRKEAALPREKTSKTVADMIKFCEDNKSKDQLMHGVPEPNPWEEKKKAFPFLCC